MSGKTRLDEQRGSRVLHEMTAVFEVPELDVNRVTSVMDTEPSRRRVVTANGLLGALRQIRPRLKIG